jgi:hypothetical protein
MSLSVAWLIDRGEARPWSPPSSRWHRFEQDVLERVLQRSTSNRRRRRCRCSAPAGGGHPDRPSLPSAAGRSRSCGRWRQGVAVMTDQLLVDTANRLFAAMHPRGGANAEQEGWAPEVWQAMADAGFPWVSIAEDAGGPVDGERRRRHRLHCRRLPRPSRPRPVCRRLAGVVGRDSAAGRSGHRRVRPAGATRWRWPVTPCRAGPRGRGPQGGARRRCWRMGTAGRWRDPPPRRPLSPARTSPASRGTHSSSTRRRPSSPPRRTGWIRMRCSSGARSLGRC